MFLLTGSVLEASSKYQRVVTVHATDRDSGPNKLIHYTFEGGSSENGDFTIDRTSGTISTAKL